MAVTLAQLQTMVLDRLGEDPTNGVFHTAGDAVRAINDAQKTFAFLTLTLTGTATITLTGNATVALPTDFIAPFRLFSGATRVQPSMLNQFAAMNPQWPITQATPAYYTTIGPALLSTSPVGAPGSQVTLTYAKMPVDLSNGTDVPQINTVYHEALVDLAVPLRRLKEGGQELQQNLPDLQRFLDAVTQEAMHMMSRAVAQRYDTLPMEWKLGDFSKAFLKAFSVPNVNAAELKS